MNTTNTELELPPAARAAIAAVDDLETFAKTYSVATIAAYEAGADDLKRVKQAAATLEATRTGMTGPLNQSLKKINDFFRAPAARLSSIESIIKRKLLDFSQAQERQRAAAQRVIDEAAERERKRLLEIAERATTKGKESKAEIFTERATTLVAAVLPTEVPKVAGLATREQWTYEVLDESKIPRRFLCVDHKKIGAYVRSMKADAATDLPGVRVFNEQSLASTKMGGT